jgi:hypothetical protein
MMISSWSRRRNSALCPTVDHHERAVHPGHLAHSQVLLTALHPEVTQLEKIIIEPFSDQESALTSYNFSGMCRVAGAHLFHAVIS